jgi:hypothetical protein
LAFALAENSILLDDIYKYELAVRSLSFHKAINLLYKAYKNSPGSFFFPLFAPFLLFVTKVHRLRSFTLPP